MTKQPSYRFTGYTEPWEEKKLGEYAKYRRGSFPQPYGKKEWYGGEDSMPFVQVIDVTDNLTLVNDTKQKISKQAQPKSVLAPEGTVIVTLQGSIGRVAITHYDTYVDRTLLIFESYNFPTHVGFWAYTIQNKFEIERQKAPGGTIKTITKEALSIFEISLPFLPEQTAIGSFFQDIDQFISLQQRKLEVLKEQKKTYLKLLFPAKEQTKPALRFAGFEDEWKEVKLGEVGETYTGLSGKTKEDFGHGEGKFITYVNVFNNPLTDLYGLDSIEIDDKQRRVQYGDVLFTTSSETPEDVGLSSVWMGTEDNVYLNSFCFGYRPQKGIFDLYYLAFVLRSFSVRREFMLLAQGISRFNISKTKVMDMFIHVPSLPEQEAIGSFFQDLDKSIAKQEEKVNQLKESKQTLLRKMFI